MINPWPKKIIRHLIGSTLTLLSVLMFWEEWSFSWFLLALLFGYISFGLDFQRKTTAKKRLTKIFKEIKKEERIRLNVEGFLSKQSKRGRLILTDRYIVFIDRKGNIPVKVLISELYDFGYKGVGTGTYTTVASTSSDIGKIYEDKVPVFFMELRVDNGEIKELFISTPKYKKFFKAVQQNLKNGVIAEELREESENQKAAEAKTLVEDKLLRDHLTSILDNNNNHLDIANKYFLQNIHLYEDALYESMSQNILKLNSLTNEEKNHLRDYLQKSTLLGHRMALCIKVKEGFNLNDLDLTTKVSLDTVHPIYKSVDVPAYPITQQVVYSHYKFFRTNNTAILSEQEILSITEEFIKLGFKNTMAHLIAFLNTEVHELSHT
ncbi:hypothetical protein [Pontibacillus yanchengensis]|uniref:DIX domain-containing protein n=1 Tax=Pontibacillus yanchengensis Y32 TaxID=1385514 RepID=A0A0A2TZF9_9BACI|nr:hypothetical protein [Pontibacillus yanchengensis]KGP74660.1 hypothetical protein N782_00090 [Pontibacillus yanchengensis Y32]